MQQHTQSSGITTNIKVKIDFTLPELSVKQIVMCNFHVYESTQGRYDMMLGKYPLTTLGLYIKVSDNVIEADDGPFNGYMDLSCMMQLGFFPGYLRHTWGSLVLVMMSIV